MSKKTIRISKEAWLSKALETLEKEGVDAVRIESLASKLGISKSGFYWHFKNRDDLLKQMLDYWAHESTAVVTANKELEDAPAEKRLENAMLMIRDYGLGKLDAAIFIWSQSDPVALKAMARVHEMRLDFLRKLFSELGFKGNELEMRAQLFVCYHSFEYVFFDKQPKSKRNSLLKLRARLLTQK